MYLCSVDKRCVQFIFHLLCVPGRTVTNTVRDRVKTLVGLLPDDGTSFWSAPDDDGHSLLAGIVTLCVRRSVAVTPIYILYIIIMRGINIEIQRRFTTANTP